MLEMIVNLSAIVKDNGTDSTENSLHIGLCVNHASNNVFSCYPTSNGSATSEDLFWKLDALQTFIRDLHWPEEEFGKHLEQRLKLMASDMIESCVKR